MGTNKKHNTSALGFPHMNISIPLAILTSAHKILIIPCGIPRSAAEPNKELDTFALGIPLMNISIPLAILTSAHKNLNIPLGILMSAVGTNKNTTLLH